MSLLQLLITLLSIWSSHIQATSVDVESRSSDDLVLDESRSSKDSNESSEDTDLQLSTTLDIDSESADSADNSHLDSCEQEDEEWDVDYIGESTQFRVFNPCDDEQFLKIKMSELTEYDLNDKPTTNKVNQFAATDWEWINHKGFNAQYETYHVIKNTFKASNIIDDADFELTTLFFKEDAFINHNRTFIPRNALKWNVNITNWPLLNDTNHLELCINLVTNRANESASSESKEESEDASADDDDEDASDSDDDEEQVHYWRAGDFDVGVFDSAECGTNKIRVTVRDDGRAGGDEKNLCFVFDPCVGNIFYDPIITHVPSRLPSDGQLITSISRALLIAVVGALGCAICVVSICYIYKRKRQGPYQGLLETQLTTK